MPSVKRSRPASSAGPVGPAGSSKPPKKLPKTTTAIPKRAPSLGHYEYSITLTSRAKAIQNDPPRPHRDATRDISTAGSVYSTQYSELDSLSEFQSVEEIKGEVWYTRALTDPAEYVEVGTCSAQLVRRDKIANTFLDELSDLEDETSDLAFALFDRYGRLKPELKNHPVKKGTGIWQDELDHGDILHILDLQTSASHRRRGIARRLISAMIDQVKKKTRGTFFVMANLSDPDLEWEYESKDLLEDELERLKKFKVASSTSFYQAFGFRRVGYTSWTSLSSDSSHPAYSIIAQDDYHPPVMEYPPADMEFEALELSLMEQDEPAAIKSLEDFLLKHGEMSPIWSCTDGDGCTLLHAAAGHFRPTVVDWILNKPFGAAMAKVRDIDGQTPLDYILSQLELERTRNDRGTRLFKRQDVSDEFNGFDQSSVACVARLRGITSPSDLQLKQITFGCTCEQCCHGFLSPKMRCSLRYAANLRHVIFGSHVEALLSPRRRLTMQEHIVERDYLPFSIWHEVHHNARFRLGFVNVMERFNACLVNNLPPKKDMILQRIRPNENTDATQYFIEQGGSVESVAEVIFRYALEDDKWAGNGAADRDIGEQLSSLPQCRNDSEFGFVAGICGYTRLSPKGQPKPEDFENFTDEDEENIDEYDDFTDQYDEDIDGYDNFPEEEDTDEEEFSLESVIARLSRAV